MRFRDLLLPILIALLVGAGAYLLSNQLLLTPERFSTDIEIVKPIKKGFDTQSTKVFTDDKREDFSSELILNQTRKAQPFDSGE